MNKTFGPNFKYTTPGGDMNFLGAVRKYFNQINGDFLDTTIEQYYSAYINHIFPHINVSIPISQYTSDTIKNLLDRIQTIDALDESTIYSTYRHLIIDPCNAYFEECSKEDNPLWGTAFSAQNVTDKNSHYITKKYFSENEEKKLVKALLSNPETDNGADVGLATSFCTGARNNEVCGLSFHDLIDMNRYPGNKYLRIKATTNLRSNTLKAGGKTINAPRGLPIIDAYSDFITKRLNFIKSQVKFPFVYGNKTYNSVLNFPISCRKNNYWERCSSDDLTAAGRILFRDVIKINEQEACLWDQDRLESYEDGIIEKDVTTYAFRRNMATHCYELGLTMTECQYYMGHEIEDSRIRRSDFVDQDRLMKIKEKLNGVSINKFYFDACARDTL